MSKRLSKNKTILSLVLSRCIIFQFAGMNVFAAEKNVDNSIQDVQYEDSLASTESVTPTNSTHYFIKEKTFSFTGTNTGNAFSVPSTCQGRMIIAIVAEDGSKDDYVNVSIHNQGVFDYEYFNQNVSTGSAHLYIIDRLGGGSDFIRYVGGRPGVRYTVNISLYTWDY